MCVFSRGTMNRLQPVLTGPVASGSNRFFFFESGELQPVRSGPVSVFFRFIEPDLQTLNISHGFKFDPIIFQIWKLHIDITSPYESGRTYLKGFSKKGKKAAAPILKGYFKKQKSGCTYLKGVFQKRKKAAAPILMGFQKSGRSYLKAVLFRHPSDLSGSDQNWSDPLRSEQNWSESTQI